MSDIDDLPKGDPPADPPAADSLAPPAALTKDDLVSFGRSLADGITSGLSEVIRQNAPRAEGPKPPVIDDVTDEQINAAVAAGEPIAALVDKRARATAARAIAALRSEAVDPLAIHGTNAINELAIRAAAAEMPFYQKYEWLRPMVDAAVKELPPENRMNVKAIVGIYNYLVGSHYARIHEEEHEASLRADEKAKETADRAASSVRQPGGRGTPQKPEDLLGPEERLALDETGGGRTFEQFCQRNGTTPEKWLELATKPAAGNA